MSDVNGTDRQLYDASVIRAAIGDQPKQVRAVAVKADVTPSTVKNAMAGDSGIAIKRLMAIVEASGASYADVFNPEFYESHRPKNVEEN